jgi:hypothetical protein
MAILLAAMFLRFGYVYQYMNCFPLIIFNDRTTPISPFELNDEWGLLARYGLFGVFLGVVTPVVLCAAAAFISCETQEASPR